MRTKISNRLKELLNNPPEALVAVMDKLDRCEDISRLEGLHVELSRALGRETLQADLNEVEVVPERCPTCQDERESAPSEPEVAGGSPPPEDLKRRRRLVTVMVSLLGVVEFRRCLWKCSHCGRSHAPLDRLLGMQGGLSGGAAEVALLLLADMPHRRARERLARLCAVNVCASTVQRLGERVGPKACRTQRAETKRQLQAVAPGCPAPPCDAPPSKLVVRQADGVMVRFRAEGHKEVKVGVSYGLGEPDEKGERPETVEAEYCAVRGEASDLGRQLKAISLRQGLRAAPHSQFLSDGGSWMKGLSEGAMRWSEWTVDYYHVSGQVAAGLKAIHGEDDPRAAAAHDLLKGKLLEKGGNAATRRSLKARGCRAELDATRARELDNVIAYLERHEPQTDYADLRRRAWPIGSGRIEGGGCKAYIQDRFKGRGMGWTVQGFRNIEAIRRTAYTNKEESLRNLLYGHSII